MLFGLMTPFSTVAVVVLLFVLVNGLANPHTRPFRIGLAVLVGLGIFLAVSTRFKAVQFEEWARQEAVQAQERVKMIALPPVPAPPKGSAAEIHRSKMTVMAALRQAIVQALNARDLPPVAEAPAKPVKIGRAEAPPRPPDWVNAKAKMEDNCYTMSVLVGPFTTPLECEHVLPSAVQGAVTEYAELLLGHEAAAVRLPDDVLLQLVRDRWTEERPMEIGDGSHEMYSMHALVVFDVPMQQRIKAETQRFETDRRVAGAAVVCGGLLGVLALAWGGLKWATRRN